jgi:CDP-glucose 4,6-dehydratase
MGDKNGRIATMNNAFWLDRPTLVTGATGLVGGWLVDKLLAQGADVVCLVRDHVPAFAPNYPANPALAHKQVLQRAKIVSGDICDQKVLERVLGEYEVDTVIHLAAQTIVGIANRNPVSTFEANIQGTWCLLEACRRSPRVKSVVMASSDKAYGDQDVLPYDENTPLQGKHPYDVSKSCSDLISQTYAHSYGLPVAITRCGNFYGGGDLNWNRIVPGTIRSVLRGQSPVIRSDGQSVRDYFYVEDGAEVYMLLAEALHHKPELVGGAFNFSDELQITVLDLTRRILQLMDSDLKSEVRGEATNEIRHQYLSAQKAREVLGWKPLFSLDEGLKRTIEWYRDYLGAA